MCYVKELWGEEPDPWGWLEILNHFVKQFMFN